MTQADINIFTPIEIGDLHLSNRIVMAPMTRNRAGQGNVPQDLNIRYYVQRASAGLMITEGSQVSPQGVGYPNTPGIHSQEQVSGWRRITDAVHQNGGRIFLQLWHVGRISHPSFQPDNALPVAPSAIRPSGQLMTYDGMQDYVTPRALETTEIGGIVEQFRSGAKNAHQAGFDGVEIHGANGYLIDQFLRDGSNHRTDQYGGPLENRCRLLLEVTDAVIEVWGSDRVGVRLSPVNLFNDMLDSDPQSTFNFVTEKLDSKQLAYLHGMESNYNQVEFDFLQLRNRFNGLYMANAGYDLDKANNAIRTGAANLVSFGTLFISNPDLPERFRSHADLAKPDQNTFYGGDEKGYTDYEKLEIKSILR